jgi:circadian clock protein KaiB
MARGSSAASRLVLRLYVVAGAPNSIAARSNLTALLAAQDPSTYSLEVVDCLAEPRRALEDGVFVTPTLRKLRPTPVQTIVGSLANARAVRDALGLTK